MECDVIMYNNLEKAYKKIDPEQQFFKYYWKWAIIVIIIGSLISSIFKVKTWAVITIIIISLIIIVLSYEHKNYKIYKKKINHNSKLFDRILQYLNKGDEEQIEGLVQILKQQNIINKNDLLLLIDHYNKNKPISMKTTIWNGITSIAITTASFMVIFVNDKNEIDYSKLSALMIPLAIMILTIIGIYVIIKAFFFLKGTKESFYSRLEEQLTYIYINYNHYKYKLRKK